MRRKSVVVVLTLWLSATVLLAADVGRVEGGAFHVVGGDVGPSTAPGSGNPSNTASATYYLANKPSEPIQVEADITDSDGMDFATFGLDVGSMWNWAVGDEVVVVVETAVGINGWIGLNFTTSSDGFLTSSNVDTLPFSNIEEFPSLSVADNGTYANVSWTGLVDENGNVLNYSVYRAPDVSGPYAYVGTSSPQVPGGPVWYEESRPPGTWCYRIAANYRRDTMGGVYVTTGQSASTCTAVGAFYIVSTDPADGETNVTLDASIVVRFSGPADVVNVSLTIMPPLALTADWNSPENTVLVLDHGAPFAPCTTYTVEVTSPLLVSGPVPNPWSFTTVCGIEPFIVATDPANGETGVPTDKMIVVDFSEYMDTVTVTWTINGSITLVDSWSGGNRLRLFSTTPLAGCTDYAAEITTGKDLDDGLDLVPGPVPNPWTFKTVCPGPFPGNLRVNQSGPDVVLSWDPATSAVYYNVYESQDRFASFPSGWYLLGSTPSSPFTALGHGGDALTHYYVVRAFDGLSEGPNSTMGLKETLSFVRNPSSTNVHCFSLPYASEYTYAHDLPFGYVDVVGKWDPVQQRSVVYYYARGRWRGAHFRVNAGDGLYFGVNQSSTWDVTGTDRDVVLDFALNPPPKGNVVWLSLPSTGVYARASDVSDELTSANISEVRLWDAATQSVVRWYWDGSSWAGTDFAIEPWSGVSLVVVADFTWTPKLLTPAMP